MNLFLGGVLAAALTWVATGPEGGSVTAVAAGETMLAGTAQGRLFRASGGAPWVLAAEFGAPIRAISGRSTTWVLAGTDLYRAGGGAWSRRIGEVRTLAIAPSDERVVYAATTEAVAVTFDGGETWVARAGGARSLAVDATDSRRLWAVRSDGALELSADGGASWSREAVGEPVASVVAHPRRAGTAYAVAASSRGYRTAGGGVWSEIHYLTGRIVFDPRNDTLFYSVDDEGRLFRFGDEGKRFTIMHGGPILSLDIAADGTLFAGFREGGVQASADGGDTWSPRSAGFLATEIHGLASARDGSAIYAGGVSTMFRSLDRGSTWEPVFLLRLLPGPFRAVAVDETDPQRVWIGAGVSMWFSGDGGVRFNRLLWVPDREPQTIVAAAVDRADRRGVWVLMSGSVLRFHTEPASLTDVTPPHDGGEQFHAVALDESDGRSVWVGGSRGLYHSADGGVTWRAAGGFTAPVTAIYAGGPLLIGTAAGNLLRSDDGGASFQLVASAPMPVTSIAFDGRAYYAAAGRVLTSADGSAWRDSGGPQRTTRLASGDVVYAATEGGGVQVPRPARTRPRAAGR